ncbi:hypothetical protein [Curtobacterium sp. MCBD17_003]|uniref:hypothetical protein n=1 Tax=Curtobacterium sp. MCBD17_003 TaxID=2175667 RepID=UPI000DA7E88E|nr:hypothetical protein [Curtobacterium sp. MCBD17_003]WIE54109.1 hypothetical protein DEI88_013420 [Curtobacterium sp. MCBD17_003]
MERGIYFDGWYPNEHCYHPSMPPRRLTMADDVVEMGGTMLVWAGLGGGVISLPYLEDEAFGPIPQRFRQHGYVNESEFIAYTKERGVDLFGIVFEAQAWEFPAEVEDGRVLAQNQLRDVGTRTTMGLREFSTDTGPADWKPFRHYFPDGLVNSDGDQVTDLWEEVVSRDLEGRPLHAHWVEVDGTGQSCYLADRNNPVWREYLKAVIRVQIDAGAPGVQLDETDVPLLALRYGGCFCKDCVKGFRAYLQTLDTPPTELAGVDLATFDYRQWLLDQGYRTGTAPQTYPLYAEYCRFLQIAITETFHEVASYVKEYAASQGKQVRVAGNFYDCAPFYEAMVDDVDVLVTEMRETKYQQPWYFRHGVGMSRGRPLVAVENPYGGITEDLLRRIQRGRAHDLFRLSIFEANAMGANMSLPYGSWLGTEVKDSYWVPKDLAVETGQALVGLDAVTSNVSVHSTAVVYSVPSVMRAMMDSDMFSDDGRWFEPVEAVDARASSYWETIECLSRSGRTFDAIVLPDEGLRQDDTVAATFAPYATVVVPDAWNMSARQHEALLGYLDQGGRVVVNGAYGTELPAVDREALLTHAGTTHLDDVHAIPDLVPQDVLGEFDEAMAVNVHQLPDDTLAVHVVNFDYQEADDAVQCRLDFEIGVRTDRAITTATVHRPGLAPETAPVHLADGVARVTIPTLDLYAVVHLA